MCPTSGNDTNCEYPNLYSNWLSELDSSGYPIWALGNGNQLPGLRINNKIYRDSDGDGTFDEDDILPLNRAVSRDSDGDGKYDWFNESCDEECQIKSGLELDVPFNAAASVDADGDGFPDLWNESCDLTCQNNSKLTLDTHLLDQDNDGVSDELDSDDNNDRITDADADGNGLIEIKNIEGLNAMRYSMDGATKEQSNRSRG